jgi:hypothetical protein
MSHSGTRQDEPVLLLADTPHEDVFKVCLLQVPNNNSFSFLEFLYMSFLSIVVPLGVLVKFETEKCCVNCMTSCFCIFSVPFCGKLL